LAVLLVALGACRSTTTTTTPITTLSPESPERSLMRIHATSRDQTQTFRALLEYSPGAMLLTAYTPLGTSAMRLYSSGNRVVFLNDLEDTTWSGTPAEFAQSFGFFDATPVTMAELILGRRTSAPGVDITYDPQTFPPKRVVVRHGSQRLDIEHLESTYTNAAVKEPEVPRSYRCCVPPRL
jgi:hypothetical protein